MLAHSLPRFARVLERVIDRENGVVRLEGTAIPLQQFFHQRRLGWEQV
jgi:hypothetical protein